MLDRGVSVEDLLSAVRQAVMRRYIRANSAPGISPQYRAELRVFYRQTAAAIQACKRTVKRTGDYARRITR